MFKPGFSFKRKKGLNLAKSFWAFDGEPTGGEGTGGGGGGTGEATGGTEVVTSLEATVPTDKTPDTPKTWLDSLPDEYKDRDYLKGIRESKTPELELLKQYDNAQKLIGKKTVGVPGEDASDADWEKYNETVRPKEAKAYEFKPYENKENPALEAAVNGGRDDAFLDNVKKILFEEGIPKRSAERIQAKYDALLAQALEPQLADIAKAQNGAVEAQKALDKEFDTLVEKTFGGDADKAVKEGRDFLEDMVSEKTRNLIPGLDNKALTIIADIARSVNSKYNKADTIDPPESRGAQSSQEMRAEMRGMMQQEAYTNSMHKDHDKMRADINALSKRIAETERRERSKK